MFRVSTTLAGAALAAVLMSACTTASRSANQKATDVEKYPFLTRPEVRTIWVPDSVDGNRYIERHRVFVIEKNSSWSKDND